MTPASEIRPPHRCAWCRAKLTTREPLPVRGGEKGWACKPRCLRMMERRLDGGPAYRERSKLSRRAELARGGPIARSPMKRSRRSPAETIRAHGVPEFRAWMKLQPCVICGRTPSDAAHLSNGGLGRKDDVEHTVPLCEDNPATGYRGHHSEYDGGKQSFRAKYGDLRAEAAAVHARWQAAA